VGGELRRGRRGWGDGTEKIEARRWGGEKEG
jgi:hypothetical protein